MSRNEKNSVKSKCWRGVANLGRKLGLEVITRMVWKRKMTQIGVTTMGFLEREREKMRKVQAFVVRARNCARLDQIPGEQKSALANQ